MGKKCDLCDFDRGMIVGARWAGLMICVTADLLGFSHGQQSLVFATQNLWCEKQKTSSECSSSVDTEMPC